MWFRQTCEAENIMRGIGIRPNTSRKLQQKQVSKVSPLHISIVGLSYLKEQQQRRQEPKEETFYRIIRPEDKKQKEKTLW